MIKSKIILLASIMLGVNILIKADTPHELLDSLKPYVEANAIKSKNTFYKGQAVKNKKTGIGILEFKNGDIYVGDFHENNIHGAGIYISTTEIAGCPGARIYVGKWDKNHKKGKGTCYDKYGTLIYDGRFDNDVPTSAYPSIRDSLNAERQFILEDIEDGSIMIGQFLSGIPNGKCVLLLNKGDILINSFKNGEQNGIGLYLHKDGSWETIRSENNELYVISSSAMYKSAQEARRKAFLSALNQALSSFAQAANVAVSMVDKAKEIKNPILTNQSNDADVSTSTHQNSARGGGVKYNMSEQQSYNRDKATYSKYDGMLAEYFSGNREASISEKNNWQNKMKQIRKKWENKGRDFPHYPNEDR